MLALYATYQGMSQAVGSYANILFARIATI
jgi:hypothetical protein